MVQSKNIAFKKVMIALLIVLSFYFIQMVHANEELIINGGFESNSFNGWQTTGICKVRPHRIDASWYEPAHSGKYSARLGEAERWGGISQTVSIPEGSEAYISFWYRVEKGCILDVILKTDGKEINSWRFTSETDWKEEVYHLDASYAGKSLTIDFKGKGYEITEYIEIPVIISTDKGPVMVYVTKAIPKQYWPYVDDVSIQWRKVEYKVTVKVLGLASNLSSSLKIDGRSSLSQIALEDSKTLTFKVGSSHTLSIDEYIYQGTSIRYYCEQPTVIVSTDSNITFTYKKQYLLKVLSPYDSVEGEGWYNEGLTAKFRILTTHIPMKGFLGFLGAKYIFKGWKGDVNDENIEGSVLMDSPKIVEAMWIEDYSALRLPVIGLLAVTGAALSTFYIFKVKGMKRKEGTTSVGYKSKEETIPGREDETLLAKEGVVCPNCGMKNPPGANSCHNCGAQLEYDTELYGEDRN
jgi:hypothetical protein